MPPLEKASSQGSHNRAIMENRRLLNEESKKCAVILNKKKISFFVTFL